tara:strand:- start:1008 stop:1250 length:243 start_codon:yes stop_codon:yes gene_type:complete
MHLRREVDTLLDELIEQKNRLNDAEVAAEMGVDVRLAVSGEIKELQTKLNQITNDGERADGLWTDAPEFLYPNAFNCNKN